jgi:Ca-activated chloride channel family protein
VNRIVIVIGVLVVALVGAVAVKTVVIQPEQPLVIVQWANSHPMRDALLPAMAEQFNDADHTTASGRPIEVEVVKCDSALQVEDLVSRVKGSGPSTQGCGGADPVLITPQSDDWLGDVNYLAKQQVVDPSAAPSIARAWVGIVTYRDIAECLGWPDDAIGYENIIALRENGWESLPDPSCAKAAWEEPKLAFTNPQTSTSGRNVLLALYAIAADKDLKDLTADDVANDDVVEYVTRFQKLVDHYMPGTIPLNTKIAQGRRYGHFFVMPEDNLVNLYKGNEEAVGVDGKVHRVRAVKDLVMIYPKEGSTLNSNPAAAVHAPWVSGEEASAAATWVDYLRSDDQQRVFMKNGFRPGTHLAVSRSVSRFGLDPKEPKTTLEPGDVRPEVLSRIMASWGAVKKPAIVTFVVDTSASMSGEKLANAKRGLTEVLDVMESGNTRVGVLRFSDRVSDPLSPEPLAEARRKIARYVDSLEADGSTALYDAVRRGVQVVDEEPGDDKVTRAVVVLSDGQMTDGMPLDELVEMIDRRTEQPIHWSGRMGENPTGENDGAFPKRRVRGEELLGEHEHPVQVFFVGFGDADIDVGRVLAQATHGEYIGSTNEDLAAVIAELGPYF